MHGGKLVRRGEAYLDLSEPLPLEDASWLLDEEAADADIFVRVMYDKP